MNTVATSTVLLGAQQFNQVNAALQSIVSATQNQSFWNTQIFAAIVGGLIGLIPFGYLMYLDRPRIKVKSDQVWIPRGVLNEVRIGFSASIYNSGRRAITVDRMYLRFRDGSALAFLGEASFAGASGLPKLLTENSSHTVAIFANKIAKDILKKESFPIAICYSDALGKEYCVPTTSEFWQKLFKLENEHEQGE